MAAAHAGDAAAARDTTSTAAVPPGAAQTPAPVHTTSSTKLSSDERRVRLFEAGLAELGHTDGVHHHMLMMMRTIEAQKRQIELQAQALATMSCDLTAVREQEIKNRAVTMELVRGAAATKKQLRVVEQRYETLRQSSSKVSKKVSSLESETRKVAQALSKQK